MATVDNETGVPDADAWAAVVSAANTPQLYACVLEARQAAPGPDPALLLAEHRRIRDAGAHADLNSILLSAGQTVELKVVGRGGAAGVNAHRLNGHARRYLTGHRLMQSVPGCRFPPDDWRATVRITLRGMAMLRAAQDKALHLNESEALPLAVLAHAMTTADGGSARWPGGDLALRVALTWGLVEVVRAADPPRGGSWEGQLPPSLYRLTPQGELALAQHRSAASAAQPAQKVSAHSGAVLEFVERLTNGDPGAAPPRPVVLQRCVDRGWVARGELVPGTSRHRLSLTAQGREALNVWLFHKQQSEQVSRLRSVTVRELRREMVVRLSNRRGFPGVGAGWVTVHEVKRLDRTDVDQLPHNYEVWVTSDEHAAPFLYGGRSVFRTTRYQVKHL